MEANLGQLPHVDRESSLLQHRDSSCSSQSSFCSRVKKTSSKGPRAFHNNLSPLVFPVPLTFPITIHDSNKAKSHTGTKSQQLFMMPKQTTKRPSHRYAGPYWVTTRDGKPSVRRYDSRILPATEVSNLSQSGNTTPGIMNGIPYSHNLSS